MRTLIFILVFMYRSEDQVVLAGRLVVKATVAIHMLLSGLMLHAMG